MGRAAIGVHQINNVSHQCPFRTRRCVGGGENAAARFQHAASRTPADTHIVIIYSHTHTQCFVSTYYTTPAHSYLCALFQIVMFKTWRVLFLFKRLIGSFQKPGLFKHIPQHLLVALNTNTGHKNMNMSCLTLDIE